PLRSFSLPRVFGRFGALALVIGGGLLLPACGGKIITETSAEPRIVKPKAPASIPMWLGNPARSFFGTGPLPRSLKIIWDFKTGFVSGRLHEDPWGGSGWPGKVAGGGERVQFRFT